MDKPVDIMKYRDRQFRKNASPRRLDFLLYSEGAGDIDLNPPYQRGSVWTLEQKVRLIDSLLRGIALPAIYLRELPLITKGKWIEVLDGKQRIEALLDFLHSRIAYNGVYFKDLPKEMQLSIRSEQISTVSVSGLSDGEAVELYERLNFSGVSHTEADRPEKK